MTEKQDQAIKHFKALLPCEKFIVTGSYVLYHLGLIDKVNDLDIILYKPTQAAVDIVKRLQEQSPAKTKPKPEGELVAIVNFGEIKIDFFVQTILPPTFNLNGIDASNVQNIIQAKKNYGRIKDMIQLKQLSNKFMTDKEFNNFMATTPVDIENTDY